MSDEPTIYRVLESSRDNPDVSPGQPPAAFDVREPGAMWVWWRTGPHPQGVWQIMDVNGSGDGAAAYRANEDAHPIAQDRALSEPSDFGYQFCHACDTLSEGYPEPRHTTACDGICRRDRCGLHSADQEEWRLIKLSQEEYDWLLEKLDEPPKELPRLRRLFEEAHDGKV